MASITRKAVYSRNVELDAFDPEANSGKLRIYSGSMPANPEAAITGTQLAELTMNATAFGAASGGVITAGAITAETNATAGTATHFRLWDSAGTTALLDGNVGTVDEAMVLNSVTISAGANVSCTAFTITNPM